jgi:hypothetical protein
LIGKLVIFGSASRKGGMMLRGEAGCTIKVDTDYDA